MSYYEVGHKCEASGGRLKAAFRYSLEASEVSQSEKSIVDAFWIEKA